MEPIKFSDFQIIPIIDSICRLEISDEEYFSSKYSHCVSNSRLSLINPRQDGSFKKYQHPPRFETSSLKIGSAVHQLLLQPAEFELLPKMDRPTAKLGDVCDEIIKNRNKGLKIYDSIIEASKKIEYYISTIDKKIPFIIEKGLKYYLKANQLCNKTNEVTEIILSDKDHDTVTHCLNSCHNNVQLMNKLHPTDLFGDTIESHNEDAMFMDYLVTYKDKHVKLRFKLKIDNWTIDVENKTITLNDLKTTSKPTAWFMNPEYGSMSKFCYNRQMAVYGDILWAYCVKQYGANKNTGWTLNVNMLVVQTASPYTSQCFSVNKKQLETGRTEFEQLLKRVAYCQLFGYKNEIDFI